MTARIYSLDIERARRRNPNDVRIRFAAEIERRNREEAERFNHAVSVMHGSFGLPSDSEPCA